MDPGFEGFDLGVDLGEGAGWDVLVEVAGEGDLVADLGLGVVHPGVGNIRQHLFGHVVLDGASVLDARQALGGIGRPPPR